MKIVSEIENVFLEHLFFEHGYLVYYSKSMHEILNSHSKHSKRVKHVLEFLFKSLSYIFIV